MINKTVIICIVCFLLCGCVESVNKTMTSWEGRHQSELIAAWGPPSSTSSDGKDGTVLIYTRYVDLGQTPGQVKRNPYGGFSYTAPEARGYQQTRMFYVNSNGYIYSWRWQGL